MGFYSGKINEDLLISLRMCDWEKARCEIDSVFEYIYSNHLSTDYTYMICTGLVFLCFSYIVEMENDITGLFGCDFLPLKEMRSEDSIEDLHNWILMLFKNTILQCRRNKATKPRKIAEQVKEYIDARYCDSEICLEQIAGHFHKNSDYLRSVFKKEMGMTITEYLTDLRMHKAKELLGLGNFKLLVIAEMVGYSDAGYFSKCFKKFFGVSPSEYNVFRK